MERPPLTVRSFDALRIAEEDGVRVYGDLSNDRIEIYLAEDGWHVDYHVDPAEGQGGGPQYVIDPADGTIRWKKYSQ